MSSITSKFVAERDLTIHTVHGEVRLNEIADHVRQYNAKGPSLNTLWDFRSGQIPTLAADDAAQQSQALVADIPADRVGKVAMVVTAGLDFGLLRIWSAYAEATDALELKIFHDCDQAIAWFDG